MPTEKEKTTGAVVIGAVLISGLVVLAALFGTGVLKLGASGSSTTAPVTIAPGTPAPVPVTTAPVPVTTAPVPPVTTAPVVWTAGPVAPAAPAAQPSPTPQVPMVTPVVTSPDSSSVQRRSAQEPAPERTPAPTDLPFAPITPAPVFLPPAPAVVTYAPVTPAPVTYAPVTFAPVTSAPVTSAPAPFSAPTTLAPATAPPTGLVVHVNPNNAASYSSGASLTDLATGVAKATIVGPFEGVTILGKRAIHLANTSSAPQQNVSSIVLPEANVRTISFWYFVSATSRTGGSAFFLFDGRLSDNGSYILLPPLQAESGKWSGGVAYINGGQAQALDAIVPALTTISTEWQHMTLVADAVHASTVFTMFGRHSRNEGMDVNVGKITCFSHAVSQSDNAAYFRQGF
jgi:hypothetical protein